MKSDIWPFNYDNYRMKMNGVHFTNPPPPPQKIIIMGQDFLDSIYGSIYKNVDNGWVQNHGLNTFYN